MSEPKNEQELRKYIVEEFIPDLLNKMPKGIGETIRIDLENARLKAEVQVLLAKVDWLQKADRLVIWSGTEWQIRHELDGKTEVAK